MRGETEMDRHSPTIESIKENIKYLRRMIGKNTIIMPQSETIEKNILDDEIKKTPYHEYIVFADYHYFVSRILFMNFLDFYSYFSGQQCIENYLKAFIRFRHKTPKRTHCLSELLNTCKENALGKEEFLYSDDISTIIYKYEPFNEMPRYPVSKTRTYGFVTSFPEDIFILDYFVYKFREIMPFPERGRDILKGDHLYLTDCKKQSPFLYKVFLDNNINYQNQ